MRPLTFEDCRPDALVLCVDDRPSPQAASVLVAPWLRAHNVYRVRGVSAGHQPGVLLEEARAQPGWQARAEEEPSFALHRFRLVDERAIDDLRALLTSGERRPNA